MAYPAVNLWLIQLHVPRAEGDVFVHRLLKQLVFRILEHQPHLKADVVGQLFAAPDVLPLEEDLPLCGADQTVEVLNQGGLAGTGASDDPQILPAVDGQVHLIQGPLLKGGVGAVNMD